MNDLPQDELFSAYLDGELTAAERAEMERLLAADPAARQLLEELRALSNTLQTLPREKLGEDLSRHVLRVAERRMLTEGAPGQSEATSVPLARSLFRRFLNRRAVAWAGLAVAVAVMIAINERRQAVGPGGDAVKEVALVQPERRAKKPDSPMTIRSVDGVAVESPREAEALVREKSDMGRPAAAAPMTPEDKLAFGYADRQDGGQPSGPSAEATNGSMPMESKAIIEAESAATPHGLARKTLSRSKAGAIAGKAGTDSRADESGLSVTLNAEPTERFFAKADERSNVAGRAAKLSESVRGVLVVRCDISPEAVEDQAFDKQLDANGVTSWHRRRERSDPIDGDLTDREGQKKEVAGNRELALPGGAPMSRPSTLEDNVDLVYVEATPAQLEATIAGLAAQPDVFLSVSVGSAKDGVAGESLRQWTDYYARSAKSELRGGLNVRAPAKMNDSKAAAEDDNELAKAAAPAVTPQPVQQLEADAFQDRLGGTGFGGILGTAQEPAEPSSTEELKRDATRTKNKRGLQQQAAPPPLAQSAPQQQVLFVLRVVGGDPPTSAAKARTGAEAATEPAEQPANGE